jgi:hypothetical protein
MIGAVVGRDELCNVIIEDLRHPAIRRPHVVVGGVGTGKTALLVRLTKLLAERGAVPVPVRLRDAQESLDFRQLAHQRFLSDMDAALADDAEGGKIWRQLGQNDLVVVLADGLEEALIQGHAARDRGYLIRLAIRQANDQRLPLVIASRPHDPLQDVEAAIVELEPLSEEAALEYVQQRGADEDSRRLDWVVETADAAETPLYLQITRQLHRSGLMDYVGRPRSGRVLDTRHMDRADLQVRLLDTWTQALVDGHFTPGLALSREDRQAALEQLSLLACIGLQRDRLQVRFDQAEGQKDPPQAIFTEVRARLEKLKRRYDLRLAATLGTQLGLVEARDDGVRFPHSIMQAFLASRLIDIAMMDSEFRDQALAESGQEFLLALIMRSRAWPQNPRPDGPDERTVQRLLCDVARHRADAKALDLYAAALQIDCVDTRPAHADIAGTLEKSWPDIWARDQRTLEEAKLNAVRRFGESARKISEQRQERQAYPAEPAYLQLYRIACAEPSYPIRLACAQEIGAGSDHAFDALAGHLGPPAAGQSRGHTTTGAGPMAAPAGAAVPVSIGNPGAEADQEHEDRAWEEGVIRAWLAPLLFGSVTERNSAAASKNLDEWLQYLRERPSTRVESDLRLSLEVALAQGFKHAANRRRRHPHARPAARANLAWMARGMLRESHFWFTRLTLVHALCLWTLPDEQWDRWDRRADDQRDRREEDQRALIKSWVGDLPGGKSEHPFVREASKLAALALETGQPERFLWIDESTVAARIGSRSANPRAPRRHNLWIPPSTGWAALHPRAQRLVADVLVLLNLAERGARPSERNMRLHRTDRHDLPPCLAGERSPLDPTRTAGMAGTSEPGSTCKNGCNFMLCPYPPKGEASYRVELSEAFCRRQQRLARGGYWPRPAPWQEGRSRDLSQFWLQMGQRSQPAGLERQ